MPSTATRTRCGRANGRRRSRRCRTRSRSISAPRGTWSDSAIFRARTGITVGNIGRYEFYVSADGTNWGAAVAIGIFSADATEKEVGFRGQERSIRPAAGAQRGERPSLHGRCRTERSATAVRRPVGAAGSAAVGIHPESPRRCQLVADACLSGGQGVKFVVDGVTLTTDFSGAVLANALGLSAAEHVVEAYLVDGSGNQVVGHTTYDRSTPVGIGDTYVAMGDGITSASADDIPKRRQLGGRAQPARWIHVGSG